MRGDEALYVRLMASVYRAVFWDFGGVVTTSPFEAFARFEEERGLPPRAIQRVNLTNPDSNAWALFERSAIDAAEFNRRFAAEADALGFQITGEEVLALLAGELRPRVIETIKRLTKTGYRQACITNNMPNGAGGGIGRTEEKRAAIAEVMALFDSVLESSVLGVRKPEPQIYEQACAALQVAPQESVFLDDLGVNLKPARAMGMATIKVASEDQALADLAKILGLPSLP